MKIHQKRYKKILAGLVSLALFIPGSTLAYADSGTTAEVIVANDENSFKIAVPGTFLDMPHQELLDRLNQIRKEAYDDGTFGLRPEQYHPLQWNPKLEEYARIRAVEASFYTMHERPDHTKPSTLYYSETLAWTHGSAMYSLSALINERRYCQKHEGACNSLALPAKIMDQIGHYYTFVSPEYYYIGGANFKLDKNVGINPGYSPGPNFPSDNFNTLAIEFAGDTREFGHDTNVLPSNVGKPVTTDINVSSAGSMNLKGMEVTWPNEYGDGNLKRGQKYKIDAQATIDYNDKESGYSVIVAPIVEGPWQSDNPDVLEVSRDGVLTPKAEGEATITFSVKWAKNMNVSKKFKVYRTRRPITNEPIDATATSASVRETSGFPQKSAIDAAPPEQVSYVEDPVALARKLKSVREAGYKEIDTLTYLTDDERRIAKEDIGAWSDLSEIAKIIADAKKKNNDRRNQAEDTKRKEEQKELEQARAQALETLHNLTELSTQDVDNFTQTINNAQTLDDVTDVVDSAQKKNEEIKKHNESEAEAQRQQEQLNAKKNSAIESVRGLADLSDSEKQEFIDAINEKSTPADVDAVLEQAQAKSADNARAKAEAEAQRQQEQLNILNAKKNSAVESIAGLTDLTSEQVDHYKERIHQAADITSVEAIVAEAEAQNTQQKNAREAEEARVRAEAEAQRQQEQLNAKKNSAIESVRGLGDLSDSEKQEFIDAINEKSTPADVDAVLEQAQAKSADNARAKAEAEHNDQNNNENNNDSHSQNDTNTEQPSESNPSETHTPGQNPSDSHSNESNTTESHPADPHSSNIAEQSGNSVNSGSDQSHDPSYVVPTVPSQNNSSSANSHNANGTNNNNNASSQSSSSAQSRPSAHSAGASSRSYQNVDQNSYHQVSGQSGQSEQTDTHNAESEEADHNDQTAQKDSSESATDTRKSNKTDKKHTSHDKSHTASKNSSDTVSDNHNVVTYVAIGVALSVAIALLGLFIAYKRRKNDN